MNVTDAFVVIALSSLGTVAVVALRALVHVFLHVLSVNEQAQTSAMDRLLADSGYCSTRVVGPGNMPADGYHVAFLRGLVVAHRRSRITGRGDTRTHYSIYTLGRAAATAVKLHLVGNPRDIALRYIYAPAAWRTSSVSARAEPPRVAYAWQTEAANKAVALFEKAGRATILVCGAMGTGKSTLCELVAVALKERLRLDPVVVKNLDLTQKGLLLEDAYSSPSANSPVVINLDEFDAMVSYAERAPQKEGAREGTSLADTPTSLLGVLDRLNRSPHHIVVATTNQSVTAMNEALYARYVRAGRFDIHVGAAL